jgi:outer membrane protein assembly factor BamA
VFPLADPARKTQLSFGAHDDMAPTFSADGTRVYYASTEDDDIFNVRSLDLKTGAILQYTDTVGGNTAPAVLRGRGGERLGFISYFKGEFRLHAVDTAEPVKEVDQEVQTASAEIIDFQPDVVHQVVPQAKRRKRVFEKLFLEGRPPLNVGVTSGGDFFGGTQVALSDVLGDQNFLFTALSFRELRSYDGTYVNLSHRLQYGVSLFDTTRFFFASPYNLQVGFSREGAFSTQRYTGGLVRGTYPLDRFRRLELSAGVMRLAEQFENAEAEQFVRDQAEQLGVPFFLNNGTLVPMSVSLVQETTRFREFGPLSGSTFSLGVEWAPAFSGGLSRTTFDADLRKYFRLGSTSIVFATRARGFYSMGDEPGIFYFGGNMELRGYPYLSFSGNQGFFANAELRFPVINLAATPLGIVGPLRGTVYFGIGGAHYKGEPFTFASNDSGESLVNFPGIVQCEVQFTPACIPEPVSGFHLVDGRASYGVGLQIFFLGYPMHFDWTKLTDLKVVSEDTQFSFWIGLDF